MGAGALYLFLILFNLGGQLLTNLAGFVIPGYYSMNALFTSNSADDTQWLTVSGAPRFPSFDLKIGNLTSICLVLGGLFLLHVSSPPPKPHVPRLTLLAALWRAL